MFRPSAGISATLRTCPVCASASVMASRIEDAGPPGLRCSLRCGACETWRGATLPAHEGFALEHRLARLGRRDRRRLSRELRHLQRLGAGLLRVPDEGPLVRAPRALDPG